MCIQPGKEYGAYPDEDKKVGNYTYILPGQRVLEFYTYPMKTKNKELYICIQPGQRVWSLSQ